MFGPVCSVIDDVIVLPKPVYFKKGGLSNVKLDEATLRALQKQVHTAHSKASTLKTLDNADAVAIRAALCEANSLRVVSSRLS